MKMIRNAQEMKSRTDVYREEKFREYIEKIEVLIEKAGSSGKYKLVMDVNTFFGGLFPELREVLVENGYKVIYNEANEKYVIEWN